MYMYTVYMYIYNLYIHIHIYTYTKLMYIYIYKCWLRRSVNSQISWNWKTLWAQKNHGSCQSELDDGKRNIYIYIYTYIHIYTLRAETMISSKFSIPLVHWLVMFLWNILNRYNWPLVLNANQEKAASKTAENTGQAHASGFLSELFAKALSGKIKAMKQDGRKKRIEMDRNG